MKEKAPPDLKAVALQYDPEKDAAPRVSASGRGELAAHILKLAKAHGLTIHEDSDLVDVLAAVDVGADIPVETFVAVAEILRYIYEANGLLKHKVP